MISQITVLLVCMLFSKALSLSCQECVLPATETCSSVQTNCSNQCLTATNSLYINGTKLLDYQIKTCDVPDPVLCESGSVNLGKIKVTINAKCCSTDLCNNETLEAAPQQDANGKTCFICNDNGCSETVSCTGNEDRCISASVQTDNTTLSMKGCATKNACVASGNTTIFSLSSVQCCEGNLCNGAESFTLSFLPFVLLVPLLSSILFY